MNNVVAWLGGFDVYKCGGMDGSTRLCWCSIRTEKSQVQKLLKPLHNQFPGFIEFLVEVKVTCSVGFDGLGEFVGDFFRRLGAIELAKEP